MANNTTTLLIYMAADNDLDPSAVQDLESIRQASMDSDMDIVVQLDRWEFVDAKEGFRYHFKQGVQTKIKELGEVNSGDPDTLKAFISESVDAYPSDTLMVVIWSHGTGVDDRDFYAKRRKVFVEDEEIEPIAIAFDDAAQEFIDNIELQRALDVFTDKRIDVLGFDACLMGMFEIAYQLKQQAKVMVGSQYLEPSTGWPYSMIVPDIDAVDTARSIGEKVVAFYGDYYERERSYVTQSAYCLEDINAVAELLDEFAGRVMENPKHVDVLHVILKQVQNFGSDYIDLMHFVKLTQDRLNAEDLKTISTELLKLLEKFVVANRAVGVGMQDAYGVSIYFPTKKAPFGETLEMYEKLDFSYDCPNWLGLIRWYYDLY